MANLLPIQTVKLEDVQNVIRKTLRAGLDADAMDDFLSSVDWSGAQRERPAIADVLGQIEALSSQLSEGDLTESQYISCLLSFLPEEERSIHLSRLR